MKSYILDNFIGLTLTTKEQAFVDSLHAQMRRYGQMTDKQVEWLDILRERYGLTSPEPETAPEPDETALRAAYAAASPATKAVIKQWLEAGLISGLRDVTFHKSEAEAKAAWDAQPGYVKA